MNGFLHNRTYYIADQYAKQYGNRAKTGKINGQAANFFNIHRV
jgi:hypothetical protein